MKIEIQTHRSSKKLFLVTLESAFQLLAYQCHQKRMFPSRKKPHLCSGFGVRPKISIKSFGGRVIPFCLFLHIDKAAAEQS